MPITGQGWELHVQRLGIHSHHGLERTYASYQVYRDGVTIANLFGNLCERIGPGDNLHRNGRRVAAGRYPLSTQFGDSYMSMNYSDDAHPPADKRPKRMPGLLLANTQHRTGILIHPGHPPSLYLSSIGCLNPTKPLAAADVMDYADSRSRVIALIESLQAFSPRSFHVGQPRIIANATIVIDGEPMNPVPDTLPSAPLTV